MDLPTDFGGNRLEANSPVHQLFHLSEGQEDGNEEAIAKIVTIIEAFLLKEKEGEGSILHIDTLDLSDFEEGSYFLSEDIGIRTEEKNPLRNNDFSFTYRGMDINGRGEGEFNENGYLMGHGMKINFSPLGPEGYRIIISTGNFQNGDMKEGTIAVYNFTSIIAEEKDKNYEHATRLHCNYKNVYKGAFLDDNGKVIEDNVVTRKTVVYSEYSEDRGRDDNNPGIGAQVSRSRVNTIEVGVSCNRSLLEFLGVLASPTTPPPPKHKHNLPGGCIVQ
jgi:hypothetical protein